VNGKKRIQGARSSVEKDEGKKGPVKEWLFVVLGGQEWATLCWREGGGGEGCGMSKKKGGKTLTEGEKSECSYPL